MLRISSLVNPLLRILPSALGAEKLLSSIVEQATFVEKSLKDDDDDDDDDGDDDDDDDDTFIKVSKL